MRVFITIDSRHSAVLLEKDAKYRKSLHGRQSKSDIEKLSNDILVCKITKKTAAKLINQLQWLLGPPKEMD